MQTECYSIKGNQDYPEGDDFGPFLHQIALEKTHLKKL